MMWPWPTCANGIGWMRMRLCIRARPSPSAVRPPCPISTTFRTVIRYGPSPSVSRSRLPRCSTSTTSAQATRFASASSCACNRPTSFYPTTTGIHMGFLKCKTALITGLASERSIDYGIANAMQAQGAQIALSYQGDKLKDRVEAMGEKLGAVAVLPLDVAEDEQIDDLFAQLGTHWPQLDILVHAIGFAPREALAGSYLDSVSRDAARIAHDISAYSFAALAKAARPMLSDRAALLTLTYMGSERAMPGYHLLAPPTARLDS